MREPPGGYLIGKWAFDSLYNHVFSVWRIVGVVVNSGSSDLVNLAGSETQNISCQCQPTGMRLIHGDSLFGLTERTDQPIVLFDGEPANRHMVVVPAQVPQGR